MRDLMRVRGPAAELLAALARDAVPVKRLSCDGRDATALFVRDDLPDWPAVRARLPATHIVEEDLAAATVVGEGIGSEPRALVAALEAARGVEILGWDASPLRLSLYLAPSRLDDVVRALHRRFVADAA
jgi:aspartokinase